VYFGKIALQLSAKIASLMIDCELLATMKIDASSAQRVPFLAESRLPQSNAAACDADLFSLPLQGAERDERPINNQHRYNAAVIAAKFCAERQFARWLARPTAP
jgi:hypothetical protein